MNLANISVGQTIKNYKELCALLGVELKTGKSKQLQLSEFELYFKYKKAGHSFIIEDIYEIPKVKPYKRGGENFIRGSSSQRLYKIYTGMKDRCYNLNNQAYNHYGGRGIKICDEWLGNFMSFYTWSIQNGYNDTLTIDRIDVNGNYEPSNCKWSTRKEQATNRRPKSINKAKLEQIRKIKEIMGKYGITLHYLST